MTQTTSNPFVSILNPQFQYTPSVATNIVDTYRKHGWTPPSERFNTQGQSTERAPITSADIWGRS